MGNNNNATQFLTREAEDWCARSRALELAAEEMEKQWEAQIREAEIRGARWALEERAHLMTSSGRLMEAERICTAAHERG